jgi:hypothetical protein
MSRIWRGGFRARCTRTPAVPSKVSSDDSAVVERFTKSLVVLSLLAAVYFEARLASSGWDLLLPLTAAALVAGFAFAHLDPMFAPRFVLFFTYLAPVLFRATIDVFRFPFLLIWTAALVGLMLASPGAQRWSWPTRWKFPLILWALTIACAWPLIVLREYDYTPLALGEYPLGTSGVGISPAEASIFVMDVAVAHLVGLLWLDWLFRRYVPDRLDAFVHEVLVPLAASALVASALGAYQGLFDLTFLSNGMWPLLRRAPGSMADANAFGMIAALWGAGSIALAACLGVRRWPWWAAAASLVCWGGVWVSGSRTALLAGAVGLAFAAYHATGTTASRIGRARALGAATVLVTIVILALALMPSLSQTPLARVRASLPAPTAPGALAFAKELWNRNRYGAAGTRMIEEFPFAGVGIGAFHTIVPDYTSLLDGVRFPPDNAQNWFRHQIAELGLLGSIGWMIWVAFFASFLLRTRGAGDQGLPAAAVKGTLVAFALVSLVGMPAQNLAVTVTFWTFAFWYVLLVAPSDLFKADRSTLSSRSWMVMIALLATYMALTAYTGRHNLRVPQRAVRFGWPYAYGLSPPEGSAGREFRWTSGKAVAVIPIQKPWLRITVWADRPHLARHPLHATVTVAGRTLIDEELLDTTPLVREVRLPDGPKQVLIETRTSPTWRPAPNALGGETQDRGLAIAWTFIDGPAVKGR